MNVRGADADEYLTGGASGEDLYRIVCEYAALGHHRSGTDRDVATTEWFVELMSDLGDVTTTPVEFDRYEANSELTVDGRTLEHLPLYYEFTGEVDTSDLAVRRFDPLGGGFPSVADELIKETRRGGHEALVICTDHLDGELVAINRELAASPSGLPTVLVAGRHYEALASSALRLRLNARLAPGRTANIEVSNDQPGRRLVLTTPLNGWFGAAGERGTGIAVLRHVAERLTDRPLTVVATGGHELGYMGAYAWVDRCTERPACIAHIGASLAVETAVGGDRRLIDSRIAMTTLGESTARGVAAALDDAGITLRCDSDTWLGEGEAWSLLGVPVLSTTGAGLDFHTPSDTPERATSPGALATVADAVHRAVAAFCDATTVCS
ncbi:MAG: M28 family peptidase [Acidimicrobiaceae bacterium]|nr:M28 family peptidase [Acidimicrobiaceae bacterium]